MFLLGGIVCLLVDTKDKHGGIGRGGRDDDLLRASLEMQTSLVDRREHSSRLNHKVSTNRSPWNVLRIIADIHTHTYTCTYTNESERE